MTHRTWRITLPPGEARCEPGEDCLRRETCARWLALIPQAGARLISGHNAQFLACSDWLDADKHRTVPVNHKSRLLKHKSEQN